jgi:ribosome production factor 1
MCFRMSSSLLSSEIANHGNMTTHLPEIFLNGFSTRLGRRVGRLLASMFPASPEFVGRRVCTFHNQRDFIFFRQHRYVFEEAEATERDVAMGNAKAVGKKKVIARLQELGPRFTLKVKWILAGTFDTKEGEYEWYHKRHEMETSRRRFML